MAVASTMVEVDEVSQLDSVSVVAAASTVGNAAEVYIGRRKYKKK